MSASIVPADQADKVAITYEVKPFSRILPSVAVEFVRAQKDEEDASFRVDPLVAEVTAIGDLQRLALEEKIQRETLQRLAEVEEKAYREAFQIGLEEGKESAFQELKAELELSLSSLATILSKLERMKSDLVRANEHHIVQLALRIAERLTANEIAGKEDLILGVIQQAIGQSQEEEGIVLRLSPQDAKFIENIRGRLSKSFDAVRKARIEPSDAIQQGGCIISTNYGEIDGRLEVRVAKIWEALTDRVAKVPDSIEG